MQVLPFIGVWIIRNVQVSHFASITDFSYSAFAACVYRTTISTASFIHSVVSRVSVKTNTAKTDKIGAGLIVLPQCAVRSQSPVNIPKTRITVYHSSCVLPMLAASYREHKSLGVEPLLLESLQQFNQGCTSGNAQSLTRCIFLHVIMTPREKKITIHAIGPRNSWTTGWYQSTNDWAGARALRRKGGRSDRTRPVCG